MVTALAREVCGAIPVLNFAGEIFTMASEGSGIVLSPNQQAMALGAVQVAGATLASGTMEKAGRKVKHSKQATKGQFCNNCRESSQAKP